MDNLPLLPGMYGAGHHANDTIHLDGDSLSNDGEFDGCGVCDVSFVFHILLCL